jgi:hypothetical protein
MQQILKFEIDVFDIRKKTSTKIVNDSVLIRSINIKKDIQLNNTATIIFNKSKAYKLIGIEEKINLYNYIKLKFTLVNNNKGQRSEEIFYFSGFITDVIKSNRLGVTPSSTVTIVVSDYSNLLKNTFYTKNLTFLDILNQVSDEFRLFNFNEIFNDPKGELSKGFYNPSQIGFIFFVFFFYKFLYKVVYDLDGNEKTTDDGIQFFKKFKIFLPFSFDVSSLFFRQVQSLQIYRKIQGVAFDLFKYVYPEPIFEFNTYETKDTVVLMIRPTPLMKFDRQNSVKKTISENLFNINTFSVIDDDDFGDFGFKKMNELVSSNTLTSSIEKNLNYIIDFLNEPTRQKKKLQVKDLIPSDSQSKEIIDAFYSVKNFNIGLAEAIDLSRNSSSVVNVIWTTPISDTVVMNESGRKLVYSYFRDRKSVV